MPNANEAAGSRTREPKLPSTPLAHLLEREMDVVSNLPEQMVGSLLELPVVLCCVQRV